MPWRDTVTAALVRGDVTHPTVAALSPYPTLLALAISQVGARRSLKRKLVPSWQLLSAPTAGPDPTTAASRVVRFVQVLAHLNTAPWASGDFAANHDVLLRLAAAHLPLIAHVDKPDPALLRIIGGPHLQLERIQNMVWVTNRQQGKTTAVGKFLAALALTARPCKTLACVYSTKQDRAAELCRAAKDYLYWVQSAAGATPLIKDFHLERDNERGFSIVAAPGQPPSEVLARPKNADACRGDAPSAAFFDEIAFAGENFWYEFALPLLQVRGRRFTCTTTPPRRGSYFDAFVSGIKASNAAGDFFFTIVNHSLACAACIERNAAAECCHRLFLVPPWKSLMQFHSLGVLMPKRRRAAFAAEVFGVLQHEANGFLTKRLVEAAAARPRVSALPPRCRTLWVAIDPPAHSRSEMGMVALTVEGGLLVVVALASIDATATESSQLEMVVHRWLSTTRKHPLLRPDSPIIPIIECNNNDVLAMSLLAAVKRCPPVFVPFTKSRFSKCVTDSVGVWTTEDNKLAALTTVQTALMEGRVALATTVTVAGREAIEPRAHPPPPAEVIAQLFEQLLQFTIDDKGKVTGKLNADTQDDLGMAFVMAVYWRVAVLHADPTVTD